MHAQHEETGIEKRTHSCNADIARQCEVQARPHRWTVHGCDCGQCALGDSQKAVVDLAQAFGICGAENMAVGSGAERRAGASNDQGVHPLIVLKCVYRLAQIGG